MKNVLKSKYDILRQQAYVIIYGTNTPLGRLFDIVLLLLIFVSVVMVMLETVKDVDVRYHGFLVFLEWVITIFFTLEYILRIISNKKPFQYIFSFYGIIDLIAILPMYLSFFIPGSKVLAVVRALRLLRVFRILDLVNFTNQANELKLALRMSRTKITVFIYFVLVICILLGSLMYVIENEESGFTSIPRSIYWCIVTLTTVGYGDISPATPMGQVVASFVMILGYGIIAVPTGIVTAEYSRVKSKIKSGTYQISNPQSTRKVCIHCNEKHHISVAKYCYQCGGMLTETFVEDDE
ncbi:ion transporter [Capnocytophaga canimorsus]|uniref:ion transporter n=1 Tax=Capnocytophaga canimorsus TaxID=28188 RepID=UPI000F4F3ADC|nr:ion transporter [Capnocytophaga canimorsus]AYW36260.1 ion transporter [Capnocytophaga canimorsus]MDT9500339.1 ion transporter [Capnocytophaga canimorsus]GJQ04660.1 ion transporter [Capnocytophaga canimorsus]